MTDTQEGQEDTGEGDGNTEGEGDTEDTDITQDTDTAYTNPGGGTDIRPRAAGYGDYGVPGPQQYPPQYVPYQAPQPYYPPAPQPYPQGQGYRAPGPQYGLGPSYQPVQEPTNTKQTTEESAKSSKKKSKAKTKGERQQTYLNLIKF